MNVALLKESFALIASCKEEFAHSFYQRLFATYPQTRQLFARTDMKKQESSLAATLAVVVASIERGDELTPTLQSLGEKHKTYGALPDHYPLVGGILLDTFKEYLGPAFTPEVEQAWIDAYTLISAQMLIGANRQTT